MLISKKKKKNLVNARTSLLDLMNYMPRRKNNILRLTIYTQKQPPSIIAAFIIDVIVSFTTSIATASAVLDKV